jgi:cystathionine gamma-lyase
MAAVTAVLGSVLRPKDALVLPSDAYYTTRAAASGFLPAMGVEVRLAPTAGDGQRGKLNGARLLWLETPSNPGLDVCDIASLSEAARAAGALVAVDNTTATCLGQRPLGLGADFSVSADTKATTGHGDLVLGHVSVRDDALAEGLRGWRTRMGAAPGPMEVWLAHRSLATLDVRLQRQCGNALALAAFLSTRKDVRGVRYPGLPRDPAHPVASRQMRCFGPVVSFCLAGREEAEAFLGACRLVFQATSFGGVHTTAERRARWGGDDVPGGFIRMSAGCEDAEDLVEDVRQALARER